MTHLSRLTLFSTTAISLGGIVFLGSLTGEAISGGKETLMGAARATVAPASSSSDFLICHTPAAAERTNTVLRLAQTRTEVPPTEMKAAVPAPAFADSDPPLWDGLGPVTYKISTSSAEAQAYFDQGLRLAYAFNHGEAQRAFRKAQKLDPSCAMCFWGEALVLGPNINLPMQADAVGPAFAAVQRALALSTNASPREQALIVALATRYTQEPKTDRPQLDAAYAAAMGKLAADFPDDNEIGLLYAEAVMDLSPWNYWQPGGHEPNPQSAPIVPTVERVLAKEPNHPGAIHFYIHAVEASDRPQRAEPHADRLRGAIPSAGHLVHMPSHIYYRVGRYLDALADNKIATTVDEKYLADTNAPMGVYRLGYYPHNVHFVLASAQMAGDGATVIAAAEKLRGLIPDEAARDIAMVHPVKAAPYFAHAQFSAPETILALPDPGDAMHQGGAEAGLRGDRNVGLPERVERDGQSAGSRARQGGEHIGGDRKRHQWPALDGEHPVAHHGEGRQGRDDCAEPDEARDAEHRQHGRIGAGIHALAQFRQATAITSHDRCDRGRKREHDRPNSGDRGD